MNHKAFWLWPFIVCLFLGLVANVEAETISATAGTGYRWTGSNAKTGVAASPSAACTLITENSSGPGHPWYNITTSPASYGGYSCGGTSNYWGAPVTNTGWGGPVYSAALNSCPVGQNWTLSGSTCTRPDCASGEERNASTGICQALCPVGFDRNAQGQCVKDCTGKSGQAAPSPSYEFANDGGAPSVGGCNVSCSNWRRSGGGTSLIPLVMVGDACTYNGTSSINDGATEGTGFKPKPKEPTSPKDCIGSGQGYIQTSSGVSCVSSGQAPEGQKPVVKTEGAKEKGTPGTDGKPDPNAPDYKKEETTTENKNGTTTEKTTTTTNGTPDGNGGTTCPDGFTLVPNTTQCTKTTVSKSSTSDFCTANPTAKACLGTEESDECIKNPDRIGCTEKGTPGTTPDIDSETRGTGVITPVVLAQIDTCPQGMLLPKGLGYYDYGPMCDFASGLKPVILAIAWLSAFFIVLGFSQGDD